MADIDQVSPVSVGPIRRAARCRESYESGFVHGWLIATGVVVALTYLLDWLLWAWR